MPMPEYRNEYFYCGIDKNGNIIDVDRKQIIGINNQYADELRDKIKFLEDNLEEWRPYMIKHGYIEEPKTPEDLIKEQYGIINKQGELIDKLSKQVENLAYMVGRVSNNGKSSELRDVSGNSKGKSGVPVKDSGKSSGSKNPSAGNEKLYIESGEFSDEQQG